MTNQDKKDFNIVDEDASSQKENRGEDIPQDFVNGDNRNFYATKAVDEETIGSDLIYTIKSWFSSKPISAFSRKISLTSAWIVLLAVSLIQAFNFILWFSASITSGVDINFSEYLGLGAIAFFVFAAFLLILSGLLFVVVKIAKTPDSKFTSVLAVVAISLIPTGILSFIGLLVGLAFLPLGVLISGAGLLAFILSLYLGIQKYLGVPKRSPFWYFIFAVVLAIAITGLLVLIILYAVLREALSGNPLFT